MKIKLTESKLKQIVAETVKKVIYESCELNTTNTIEDISYFEVSDEGYIDGIIFEGKIPVKHPLAVALLITPTVVNPAGMSYEEYLQHMFSPEQIEQLTQNGLDINNPPTGFLEFGGFEKDQQIMWVYDSNDVMYPMTSYWHKPMFEYGGELSHKSPTDPSVQKLIKVLRIGNYI
jgi:hypothetical protein